jgi:hypothetical protein
MCKMDHSLSSRQGYTEGDCHLVNCKRLIYGDIVILTDNHNSVVNNR